MLRKLVAGNLKNSELGMIFRGGSRDVDDPTANFVWEIWPSKGNLIISKGLFITGSQPALFIIAIACAVVPFYSLVSSRTSEETNSASFMMLCVWFAIVILLILKIAFSDPGIIPRRSVAERIYSIWSQDPHHLEYLIDPFKDCPGGVFCRTCQITRPSNAHHCSECDNCVIGFDHHCAVLNNCIGQRNYLYFFGLMPSLCLLVISFMFQIRIPSSDKTIPTSDGSTFLRMASIFFLLIALACLTFVVGLCVYHTWLLLFAKTTTKRHLKGLTSQQLSIWERLKGHDALFHLRTRIGARPTGLDIL